MSEPIRPELGNYISLTCYKDVIKGIEGALGDKVTAVALISAGRASGKRLAESWGLAKAQKSLEEVAEQMNRGLGKEGLRLCLIEKIVHEEESYKVYATETLCGIGEPQGSSRKCTYTLGTIWGVLEQALNMTLRGQHTHSTIQGNSYDIFEFTFRETAGHGGDKSL